MREAFIDATFARAKNKGAQGRKTKGDKGTQIMAVADRNGLPSFCLRRERDSPRSDASYVHLVTDGCSRRAAELDR